MKAQRWIAKRDRIKSVSDAYRFSQTALLDEISALSNLASALPLLAPPLANR